MLAGYPKTEPIKITATDFLDWMLLLTMPLDMQTSIFGACPKLG